MCCREATGQGEERRAVAERTVLGASCRIHAWGSTSKEVLCGIIFRIRRALWSFVGRGGNCLFQGEGDKSPVYSIHGPRAKIWRRRRGMIGKWRTRRRSRGGEERMGNKERLRQNTYKDEGKQHEEEESGKRMKRLKRRMKITSTNDRMRRFNIQDASQLLQHPTTPRQP